MADGHAFVSKEVMQEKEIEIGDLGVRNFYRTRERTSV